MSTQDILHTKLFIPPPRPVRVPRPRLINQLTNGLHSKLTLISAPAGFGKTSLLSEWVEVLQSSDPKREDNEYQLGWFSLDEGDNDPALFLTYFIFALNRNEGGETSIGEEALSLLQAPKLPPIETILTSLINEIASYRGGIVLFLDDYHFIESSSIDDALQFILEHQPPQLRIVIASRVDPQLPLARLRARDLLTEIRAVDLRFTSSEAADFLNRVMGLSLSGDEIATLESRTEGWIAGLQLAAISMRGVSDIAGFIHAFKGSHQFVLDYLVEEVLDKQSEPVKKFLMQTSILNSMSGSLCDALTGREDCQKTLENLDHANIFITPLDSERRWYRYHHLFAGLLQQRLHTTLPDSVNNLHSKAVIWYEAEGNLSEAIHHALASDDVETATRLIEKGTLEALGRSEIKLILTWVDLLPESALESSPSLLIYHSWALLLTGQLEGIGSKLEKIGRLLDELETPDEYHKKELLGYFAGLKAIMALWQRDLTIGLDLANQALEMLPEKNWVRGYCAIVLGSSFLGKGDLNAASDAYASATAMGVASGNRMLSVSAACNLAYLIGLKGQVQQAIRILLDTLEDAKRNGKELPVAGYVYVDLARPIYQLNDLVTAKQYLEAGIEQCQRLADGRAEKIGQCLLARVQIAQGEFEAAQASIQRAEDVDPSPGTPFDLRGGEHAQIWLWLKQGKLNKLESWLQESIVNITEISFFKTKLDYTMHARVMIALSKEQRDNAYLSDALKLLDELLDIAEQNGWGIKVVEILILQALGYQFANDTSRSESALEKALILAEPENFIRIFANEGQPMKHLLQEALNRGATPEYIHRLLGSFSSEERLQTDESNSLPDQSGLIEPLSDRELEVLQHISEGLTNRVIADRLYLSLNTVKVHTRNIYGKLGVNNRTQAVSRARELGLLLDS
jgi:LuxR family maltose regulon positive regulatory protein